jgi:fluoroquinolone resistance protein
VLGMAERVNGRPIPETVETLTGEDWYGEELSGRVAEQITYVDLDLTESRSTGGLAFTECVFRRAQFSQAVHTSAAFLNCTFLDCDFFGASFVECKFLGSMFSRCRFERMTVRGGDWSFVGLPGAKLGTACFEDLRIREADLTGARLVGGVLRRADLANALLGKAELDRCDLRGSDVTSVDPFSVSLTGAVVDWQQALVIAGALGLDVRPD